MKSRSGRTHYVVTVSQLPKIWEFPLRCSGWKPMKNISLQAIWPTESTWEFCWGNISILSSMQKLLNTEYEDLQTGLLMPIREHSQGNGRIAKRRFSLDRYPNTAKKPGSIEPGFWSECNYRIPRNPVKSIVYRQSASYVSYRYGIPVSNSLLS